jgi:hypothetical protein
MSELKETCLHDWYLVKVVEDVQGPESENKTLAKWECAAGCNGEKWTSD